MAHLELRNVTVEFPILDGRRSFRKAIFRQGVGGLVTLSRDTKGPLKIRALDDISLEVHDGDRLGLIGPNGAGKSTLLRVLAGVFPPTSGSLEVTGRISSLLSTTLGMDMDDTGFENIAMMGLFLGMSPSEIREKTAEIADFTELEDFLSLPIRTYSSGMLLRLAFAIATSIEPDILLLDEGLGAGDASFADRAKQRVDDLVARSSILVLASRADALIQQMCNKAVFLNKGHVETMGEVDEVIEYYHQFTGTTVGGRV